MKKLMTVLLTLILIIPVSFVHGEDLQLHSQFAYAYDGTSGQVLYDKAGNEKMFPASMTKVMTVYTALEKIKNLDEKITVVNSDVDQWWAKGASIANLEVGMTPTYRDLLYGALYPSGADACYILATRTYGSEEAFIKGMNDNAKKLGMDHTHFKEVFNGRRYHATVNLWYFSVLTKIENKYHVSAPLILGAKSGYTNQAQHCLASAMALGDHDVFIVTGHAQSDGTGGVAVQDANTISQYLNNTKKVITPVHQGDVVKKVSVCNAKLTSKTLIAKEDVSVVVDKSIADKDVKVSWDGPDSISAPYAKNKVIGKQVISANGQKLKEITYKNDKDIKIAIKSTVEEHRIPIIVLAFIMALILMIHHRNKKIRRRKARRKRQRQKQAKRS